MPVANYSKFQPFVRDALSGLHQLVTPSSHILKMALAKTAPSTSLSRFSQITETPAGFGYTTGGQSVDYTGDYSGGTVKITLTDDVTFQAVGGTIEPIAAAILYNDSITDGGLIGFWDLGKTYRLFDGQSLTLDVSQTNGVLGFS